ncbi:copper resistance protein [Acaryochloris thomasi]|uniref:copper resistance protein n=1 Tax=Acaryochloris thomasi TaxID=2929456 RepID=UPI000DA6C9CC|nr:copper resistance protein [Acaryochloris thomasi]
MPSLSYFACSESRPKSPLSTRGSPHVRRDTTPTSLQDSLSVQPTTQITPAQKKLPWLSIGIEAHGRVAIGISAHGFVALGVSTHGVISIGVISMGVVSIGLVSMGVLSSGLVSMGLISLGQQTMSLVKPHVHSIEAAPQGEAQDHKMHH